jgi:hypothetical protein
MPLAKFTWGSTCGHHRIDTLSWQSRLISLTARGSTLDILAIPAMATDCERSFSLAKLTLTTQRLSMTTETLEKLQCLKNWVRHGAVKLGATAVGRDELQWEIGNSSMENTDVEI